MKMTHSIATVAGVGESLLQCGTQDPEEQHLARKLLELALELGIEVCAVGKTVGQISAILYISASGLGKLTVQCTFH